MSAFTALFLGLAAMIGLVAHGVTMIVDYTGATSPIVIVRSASTPSDTIHDGHGGPTVTAEVEPHTCGAAELVPPLTLAAIDGSSIDAWGTWSGDGLIGHNSAFTFEIPTTSPSVRRAFLQVYLN